MVLVVGIAASAYWIWQRYLRHTGEESVATATGPSSPAPPAESPSGPAAPPSSLQPSPGPASSPGSPSLSAAAGSSGSSSSSVSAGAKAAPGALTPAVAPPPRQSSSPPSVPPAPQQQAAPGRASRATAQQPPPPAPGDSAEPPPYNPGAGADVTGRSPSATPAAPPLPAAGGGAQASEGRDASGAAAPATSAASAQTADRVLHSGLELAFRINPPDAWVLLDGGVIGQASQLSGEKGGAYLLPGTGPHLIKIKKPGMKTYLITVEASAARSVTPVVVNLQALPAAQVDTSDLQTVRVREAVALHLQPEVDATIQVDGTSVGSARRYAGRFGHPEEWLTLPVGTHRVTVIAAGYARHDLAVEITAGAEKARQKVDVAMSREAGN
jgi:hypothetical protein